MARDRFGNTIRGPGFNPFDRTRNKKKEDDDGLVLDEVTGERVTPEELEIRKQQRAEAEDISKPTTQEVGQPGLKKLTSEEKFKIAESFKDSPFSVTVDEYGRVTKNPETKGGMEAARIEGTKRALGVQTDEQILQERAFQQETRELTGQIGQFERLPVEPTGYEVGEALLKGGVEGIPRAISTIAGLNILSGATGAAGGQSAGAKGLGGIPKVSPFLAAATALGFVADSLTSDFKDQRRDMAERPRVVLQDGKTALGVWVTEVASDPANRVSHLAEFNKQLALIDQAYRQVKLDTAKDPLLFDRNADLLADFGSFYDPGSERDQVLAQMQAALATDPDPDYMYRMAIATENIEMLTKLNLRKS